MYSSVFEGIVVLDLTQALAGPHCTQLLADFGAQVIKIEHPSSGDQARGWGPPFLSGESTYFMGTNRNKRSVALDLKRAEARTALQALIKRADVLIHNVPKERSRVELGIDYRTVSALNPRLVWVSISGFGLTGPYAEKPGYDVIAQAMSGTMYLTGEPDAAPTRFPTPMADITTGMYAAFGIASALFERTRSGEGQAVDVALLDCQLSWLSNVASAYLATGTAPQKRGNVHPNIAPYQPFQAADGWLIVAAGTEPHWRRLVEALDSPADLLDGTLFGDNAARVTNRVELERRLNAHFASESVEAWIKKLEAVGIPCGPILRPEQVLNDPQVVAREMVVTQEHPTAGTVRSLGNPVKLGRTPATGARPAPRLGEHTDEVLREAGVSDALIAALTDTVAQRR